MSLYWNPWTVPFFVLALGQALLAVIIYRARPDRFQNRVLALVLLAEGVTYGSVGIRFNMVEPADVYSAFIAAQVGWLVVFFAYLAFLGTLDTPLSRPLGTPAARWSYVVLFAAGALFFVGWPQAIASGVGPGGMGRWYGVLTGTGNLWWWITAGPAIYGLFVGVSLFRRATPGTPGRARAKAYLAAFASRDLGFIWTYGLSFFAFGAFTTELSWFTYIATSAAFSGLLAYGILKTQLLDIDLRVKRTVKQGTVVASLVGAYILTNLGARAFMSADAAQTTGIVLTGLLLFALVPLQRFGGRVADAALPGVRADEAYLDHRKLEVYCTALEDALTSDGNLDPHEEVRLAGLRARLGVTDRDHAVLLHAAGQPGETTVLPTFEPGRTVLNRYRIEEILGEGGQGTTYKALDTTLGREVVLKALHGLDTKRVLREARALAAIQHPNVVTIHDVERVGDHVYIIMEHVDGGSLKERLAPGALEPGAFAELADNLLAGLQAIHDAALVHRDVKPSNVLLSLDGQAKIADLGIATTSEPSDQTTLGAGSTNARGTIAYMSPEQARGDKLTPTSDLFSAGLVLYEAYTGRPMFNPRPGESPVELQARVAGWSGFEEELDEEGLDGVFERALAPSPEDRYESAAAMRATLQRSLVDEEKARVEARPSGDQEAV